MKSTGSVLITLGGILFFYMFIRQYAFIEVNDLWIPFGLLSLAGILVSIGALIQCSCSCKRNK